MNPSKRSDVPASTEIFSCRDGWHLPNEVRPVIDERLKEEWKRNHQQRQRFAVTMADEFNREGVNIDVKPELDKEWLDTNV